MKFNIENSQICKTFDEVEFGEICLDDDGFPYIKTPDVRSCYNGDMYNCVRLSDGRQYYFQCDEQVHIPINYVFRIKI